MQILNFNQDIICVDNENEKYQLIIGNRYKTKNMIIMDSSNKPHLTGKYYELEDGRVFLKEMFLTIEEFREKQLYKILDNG
jgi:uncharacterized protein (DUF2147 family)